MKNSSGSLSTWAWIGLSIAVLFALAVPAGLIWSRSQAESLANRFAANPIGPLSHEEEATILNYVDRNAASRTTQERIVQAALARLPSYDADIFMALVERYRESPKEWQVVRGRSIAYINAQSPGSELALSYLRQRVGEPKVHDLDMAQILGTPRDMKLIAAIALMFEAEELSEHRVALQRLMHDVNTPPGVKGLIRYRIDGGAKGASDVEVEGTGEEKVSGEERVSG